jgi:hypothetical protein
MPPASGHDPSHAAKPEGPNHPEFESITLAEAEKSFPQGVGPGPPDRESFNNRFQSGCTQ